MEERKLKEIEYYDKTVVQSSGDFEGFKPQSLASFRYLYQLLGKYCRDKIVLDYGCGNGVHSLVPLKAGAKKVIGIDLSEKSLEIARNRTPGVEFLVMDCEKMTFPDDYFDVILDGGAFSSLDSNKSLPELARVLKPEGVLIGIETFGHNPLTNLKRKLNKLTGKRTPWAASHIFRQKDLKLAKNYFLKIEVKYFHLFSWLAFPFLRFPGGKLLLKILEFFDRIFLTLPSLKKYGFKIVFVFSKNP